MRRFQSMLSRIDPAQGVNGHGPTSPTPGEDLCKEYCRADRLYNHIVHAICVRFKNLRLMMGRQEQEDWCNTDCSELLVKFHRILFGDVHINDHKIGHFYRPAINRFFKRSLEDDGQALLPKD